jgi:hypothetical protein
MTRSRFLTILVALALFLGSASLVQGQSTNCAELYATANALLTQAKSALDKGDLATAAALINSARALLTPCLSDSNCPSVIAVNTLLEQAGNSADASVISSLLLGAQAAFAPCLAVSAPAATRTATPTETPFATRGATNTPRALAPTATPRTARPTATPRVAPATTRTFTTVKSRVAFSLRYPTAWFEASELNSGLVVLGSSAGGWVAAGLGVPPREATDIGLTIGVLRLDSPPRDIANLLRGVLSSSDNIRSFSPPRSARIGNFNAAYSDIGTVGRRVVLIDLGNNYVALANVYAQAVSMNRLYPQTETILASLRVR